MRLELFGAIALTTLATAACSSDDTTTLGQGSTDTGGAYGMGGSVIGVGGSAGNVTGMGGSQTGAGGTQIGAGGNQTGAGGTQTGAGGTQTGAGGNGAGGVATITCPATQPTNGDTCGGTTGRAGCSYGNTSCRCARSQQGGTTRTWRCFTVPDGGFQPPPGRDGGFTIPDGGFMPPSACTQASDCTGGVCCQFQGGGGRMICLSSAQCTQFGGTPTP